MKKNVSILVYYTSILLCAFIMAACSSDNEDSIEDRNEDESPIDNSKRIVRIIKAPIGNGGYYGSDETYAYDTQGRIVSVKSVISDGETTYHYDQNSIQSHSQSEDHIYTLSNGLIVKDLERWIRDGQIYYTHTYSFKYDENGYLTTIIENDRGEEYTKDVVWKNGDIVKIGSSSRTYSGINWNKNVIFKLDYSINPDLFINGYYGKLPSHMPASIDFDHNEKYVYSLDNDYISKITVNGAKDGDYEITIFWE